MIANIKMRCPECGGEMIQHVFKDRVYYICKKCGKEMVVPLSFI